MHHGIMDKISGYVGHRVRDLKLWISLYNQENINIDSGQRSQELYYMSWKLVVLLSNITIWSNVGNCHMTGITVNMKNNIVIWKLIYHSILSLAQLYRGR